MEQEEGYVEIKMSITSPEGFAQVTRRYSNNEWNHWTPEYQAVIIEEAAERLTEELP